MRVTAAGVVVLALALAGPAFGNEQHPTQGELEAELVCPACHEPLDESSSPIAQQMKAFIRTHIALGWSKSRIEDSLVQQLGPGVLGVPSKHGFDLLAWALPLVGIVVAACALGAGAWAWSRNRPSGAAAASEGAGPPLDAALDRRVDEELARFDG
jgi:cytochrome c-type biogenesis protein CcmH/NrfF